VVPMPASLQPAPGAFRLTAGARVRVPADAPTLADAARLFAEQVDAAGGPALVVETGAGDATTAGTGAIVLELDPSLGTGGRPDLPAFDAAEEAYRLTVDAAGIRLAGATPAAVFRGLQTLAQLIPPGEEAEVPAVDIRDRPRFGYRGMHLDVGRHLFPVEFVERYIDLLSRFRMNAFHWHLTEDQGWRIEIDAYPELTRVGAWRAETQVGRGQDSLGGDGIRYGGFYTRDEVRRVVEYAAARHVTVVPEIEMPGHARAAIAAYPELGCGYASPTVATTWGVHEEIFCPSETTFAFLETVLGEVMELFPSPYIHIGGDEAPKAAWEASEVAQAVIEREGLEDEAELQSWFIHRIEAFLNANGRRLIGWDEILEGGLAPNATVMSWRGMEGGIEAARSGHDVIMTPTSHVYLDYYQGDPEEEPLAIGGFLPLERVYALEPVPEELTDAEARHVLGGQANLWTEYIPTAEQAEYMAYPRAIALAEVLWSPAALRDPDHFLARLPHVLRRLDRLDVNYRPLGP
ncbi:MAG: beta-N-acetylhexosaminidase, partial [Gemmatimonadota bacterium]